MEVGKAAAFCDSIGILHQLGVKLTATMEVGKVAAFSQSIGFLQQLGICRMVLETKEELQWE